MIQFICLFFPAVLSVWIYERLAKQNLKGKAWFCRYALNVLLVNLFCFAVKQYFLDTATYPLADPSGDMLPSAALNYCFLALPAAIVLPVIQVFCRKHTAVTVEGDGDDI